MALGQPLLLASRQGMFQELISMPLSGRCLSRFSQAQTTSEKFNKPGTMLPEDSEAKPQYSPIDPSIDCEAMSRANRLVRFCSK